jgi:hypothetical protein
MSSDDFVSRNVARNANNAENSIKWKQGIDDTLRFVATQFNDVSEKILTIGANDYLETLLTNGTLASELN